MKRYIVDIASCSCEGGMQGNSQPKRRRFVEPLKESTPINSRRRVRFASCLVKRATIPAVEDEEEKRRLFYSNADFARFAVNERLRRDTFVLTMNLCREQTRRLGLRSIAVSAPSIIVMYHKVLSRTEDLQGLVQARMNKKLLTGECQETSCLHPHFSITHGQTARAAWTADKASRIFQLQWYLQHRITFWDYIYYTYKLCKNATSSS